MGDVKAFLDDLPIIIIKVAEVLGALFICLAALKVHFVALTRRRKKPRPRTKANTGANNTSNP